MVRLITLLILWPCVSLMAQQVSVDILVDRAVFKEGPDTIMVYQITDRSMNGKYARSNYVHPLYTLDGGVITEDFPVDHLHHRGVFWAWHQLYIGDKRIGDGWEIKDFSWYVTEIKEVQTQNVAKSIKCIVHWKSPLWVDENGKEKSLVREETTITVYPITDHSRKVDFKISLLALEPNMRFGGSEDEKGYGGFSIRMKLSEDIVFRNETGELQPTYTAVDKSSWMDISGSLGQDGVLAGVTLMSSRENPDYPNPWILRSKGSMQNAVFPYPGKKAIPLSNKTPLVLKYRLVVHQGLDPVEIQQLSKF